MTPINYVRKLCFIWRQQQNYSNESGVPRGKRKLGPGGGDDEMIKKMSKKKKIKAKGLMKNQMGPEGLGGGKENNNIEKSQRLRQ